MNRDFVYDIETFPNVFTIAIQQADGPFWWSFEISDWRNDTKHLLDFLMYLKSINARMIGFNNLGFDYPVLHSLIRMGKPTAASIYAKAQSIINSEDRFAHLVYPSDRIIPQIDLFKIHHFDNMARSTSLKALEFNMRSDTIQDLPFSVGTVLDQEQIKVLHKYNRHDVEQTKKFYEKTIPMIRFREELSAKYGRDFLNHNDTKIGKDYFVMELEKAGVQCYNVGPGGRTPRQTHRPIIDLNDAILPWIEFESYEFSRVLRELKATQITETKNAFKKKMSATVEGFEFIFGLGGIHGSVSSRFIYPNPGRVIVDLDVTSYYPNLAIQNGFYPAHLGKEFVEIYSNLFQQRRGYSKKSSESAMLKLALNGVYGDSNNKFSPFYDPLFTMKITLNGQLLLCLLAEKLIFSLSSLEIIQINTDGITVELDFSEVEEMELITHEWESLTKLNLEQAWYSSMAIRDVNNYIAHSENGPTKRKGAYEYDIGWHQNGSALVVPKVAEKVIAENLSIRETVINWPDRMDFMLRIKVPRSSYLQWGDDRVQNITRYYVSNAGKKMFKWMPPLKGGEWRKFAVEKGWFVQVCNDMSDATLPINYEYYIQEVEKLLLGMA